MDDTLKTASTIQPVLEVTLIGRADLAVWRAYLQQCGFALDGFTGEHITVILSATDASFYGVPFREFSISVQRDATQIYLLHAFNAKRIFALIERAYFRTPYYHAQIVLSPLHVQVLQPSGIPYFEAYLPTDAHALPHEDNAQTWQIWLPQRQATREQAYFYAQLEGETTPYSVQGASVQVATPTANPALACLGTSHFELLEWRVRPQGKHSKSHTYRA